MSKPITMPTKISDLLSQARRQSFIGRQREISLFRDMLLNRKPDKILYYLHGPGGQGKTTLIRHFQDLCREEGYQTLLLDGRELEAHPASVLSSLAAAAGHSPGDHSGDTIAAMADRVVLFIDSYEKLNPLDDWFRTEFLPQLPSTVVSVLCGRKAPSMGWSTDPGWKLLMEEVHLRNFSQEESEAYLKFRNIPGDHLQAIQDFTHGHPLALSLVSDILAHQVGEKSFNPEETPDMVGALLDVFLQEVPGPAHKAALEVAALVNITTESVLSEVLGVNSARELFEWLRQLSFIDQHKEGIYPHDIIREALIRDLKWRHPDYYYELYDKTRLYYIDKLNAPDIARQRKMLSSLVYLHRLHPMVKPFFDWQESGGHWIDAAVQEDWPALIDMAKRHEGEESAQTLAFWLKHPAAQAWVWRDADKQPAAFVLKINADQIEDREKLADPVVDQALEYCIRQLGLRGGEHLALFRYWIVKDTYQAVSALQSSIFLGIVQYYFTPGLAISMLACANPAFWLQMFNYAGLQHLGELDFHTGNKAFGWYMHDWRKQPVADWLEMLGKRGAGGAVEGNLRPAALQVLVLSESAFETAVNEAMKNYRQRDLLAENPLVRSNLVIRKTGGEASPIDRIEALQSIIAACLGEIERSPVDSKFHRVLYRTFINPVGSQEKVADFLNMSFSTYRRYLKTGIERITALLWKQECSLVPETPGY